VSLTYSGKPKSYMYDSVNITCSINLNSFSGFQLLMNVRDFAYTEEILFVCLDIFFIFFFFFRIRHGHTNTIHNFINLL